MKKIFVILFLLVTNVLTYSQKNDKYYNEIKETFWGDNDKFKNVIDIPEKWKNESAVIIAKEETHEYTKLGKVAVIKKSYIRRRIKLLDQASIKEFSEFTINEKMSEKKKGVLGDSDVLGIKIIKPNGTEFEIDTKSNIKVVDNTTKIAVPNLEVNDIIDVFYLKQESKYDIWALFIYDEITETLQDEYPIMNFKLAFSLGNNIYMNFNSFSGAPKLEKVENTKDKKINSHQLIAKDIEKYEDVSWYYPLLETPSYKYCIAFSKATNKKGRSYPLMSEDANNIKSTVTENEVSNLTKNIFKPLGNLEFIEEALKDKKFKDDEEKIRYVYYYIRYRYLTRSLESNNLSKSKSHYLGNYFLSRVDYFNLFMAFFKDNKIEYDFVIANKKSNGKLEDIFSYNDAEVFIRTKTKNPIYIDYYSPFSNIDEFDSEIEDTDAYLVSHKYGKEIFGSTKFKLPTSKAEDNLSKTITKFSLDNFEKIVINREFSIKGNLKYNEQVDKLNYYDYVQEDKEKYATKRDLNFTEKLQKDKVRNQEIEALEKKIKEVQQERLQKSIASEFDVKEVDNYTITIKNTGRYGKNSSFDYEESFEIKNELIKKAGENYIIEIGKILTSQREISEKEKDRKYNIYMPFPRSFENEIIFTIPDGYSAYGIEKLNSNVKNQTGEFVSKATVEGNKLIVSIKKTYNNSFEPNKNWNLMIEFLDAAFQFTQEKIILKKA
ncbi:hypothetical protein [Flavobacterium sp.]|uniref:hypothetical protein n=1 Tax=Flavobacterium sp. TaxID=239 RepID=UPI004047AB5C